WMCDDGRLSYTDVEDETRIRRARVRGPQPSSAPPASRAGGGNAGEVPWDMAVDAAAERLRQARDMHGAASLAAVASAHVTNEDLFLFGKFAREVLGVEETGMIVPAWEPDGFLIQAEKAPNAAGARAIGIGGAEEARNILARCAKGEVKALLVLGADLLGADDGEKVLAALEHVETIVCVDTHESEISRLAHIVLPAQSFAEKDGTLTNAGGRVQRIRPAIRPVGEALPEWEILSRIAARMGARFPCSTPREVLKELAGAVPVFAGVSLESVGTHGVPLSRRA
ncbi:MAG: molybdopterin-dependent oxidoreductase, partial [Myxococcota bacterium]